MQVKVKWTWKRKRKCQQKRENDTKMNVQSTGRRENERRDSEKVKMKSEKKKTRTSPNGRLIRSEHITRGAKRKGKRDTRCFTRKAHHCARHECYACCSHSNVTYVVSCWPPWTVEECCIASFSLVRTHARTGASTAVMSPPTKGVHKGQQWSRAHAGRNRFLLNFRSERAGSRYTKARL